MSAEQYHRLISITPLQGDAWEAWNDSYHEEGADAYRALGYALYKQDVRERIAALLASLDEQNRLVDTVLSLQDQKAVVVEPLPSSGR